MPKKWACSAIAEIKLHAQLGTRRPLLRHPFRRMGKTPHLCTWIFIQPARHRHHQLRRPAVRQAPHRKLRINFLHFNYTSIRHALWSAWRLFCTFLPYGLYKAFLWQTLHLSLNNQLDINIAFCHNKLNYIILDSTKLLVFFNHCHPILLLLCQLCSEHSFFIRSIGYAFKSWKQYFMVIPVYIW